MSVSKQQLDEVRLTGVNAATATNELDWIALLTDFAEQYEMQLNETLRWISSRTSLQVACEVMGIPLSPSIASKYTPRDLEMLNSLGDVLWTHGCKVPRLMEHRRMEYVRKGRDTMGFSLTPEEYLRERAAGKSKNKIAKQQGISGPALFHWLNKWGLKDVAVEQQEIEQMLSRSALTSSATIAEPSADDSDSESIEKANPTSENDDVAASLEGEALPATSAGGEAGEGSASGEDGTPGYVLYPRRKLHVVGQPSNQNEVLLQKQTINAEQSCSVPAVTAVPLDTVYEKNGDSEVLESKGGDSKGHDSKAYSQAHDSGAPAPSASDLKTTGTQVCDSNALDSIADIHIPLVDRQGLISLPKIINTQELSRDELMQMGIRLLQEAVGRAYGDLSDLLGTGPAGEQIHQYVAHQVEKFIGKKG
ncbi:hypothetical protein [Alicyclobacillus ferrooxydans]|uniref:Uncharacterized protein n=1 Tax=Alicyclobacillus ferrooxydans TaxID=471514 RepID=A0A0P9EU01_9BACL|nr:hypothetical protein [Alicyclobacillus ferrooxydans]KPV42394.1 hypothetical protein AN477_17445 [Alicyclobacillus ferrooxydans]